MGSDDVFGHVYIDPKGKEYSDRDYPANWVFHYYFKENEGWPFMKKGPQRRIVFKISPYFEFPHAKRCLGEYRHHKFGFKKDIPEEEMKIISNLERMISGKIRDLEIKDSQE